MTYIKASVKRAKGNPGIGIQTRDHITLIDIDDIAYFPARNAAGVVIADDIVMKPGAYSIDLYLTPGTAEITSAADGDTDAKGFTPSIKFNHPGNELEVREFKANWISKKCVVIVQYCSGKDADLIGSPCNPCEVAPSYTGNKDSNTNEFTVTQISKGDDIAIYKGTIPQEEPVSVVEVGATIVEYVGDGQYQLSTGVASITEVSGGNHGSRITLLGVAGESPVVISGSSFMLKEGLSFTATEGSQITFYAFDDGSGTLKWIEQSRFVAS